MLSLIAFKRAIRAPWRVWRRVRAWWYGHERWRIYLHSEWNTTTNAPTLPPWDWQWRVPWRTHRQPTPFHGFRVQFTVLKFVTVFEISRDDRIERHFALLLTLAVLWWWRCA
jgi:hypothetical protein